MSAMRHWFCFGLLLYSGWAWGAAPLVFNDGAEERRFQALTAELRCLVCQNQSLADSHAELAQDLRQEVYRLMQSGSSDAQIIEFLVQRYGDFVIYRPPFKRTTWLLWLMPFALGIIAVAGLVYRIKTQRPAPELSANEQQQLDQLLKTDVTKT